MLKITELKIAPESLGQRYLLVGVTPKFEYVNNTKTDKIIAYGYTIALPDKAFEKIVVKIDGDKILDVPEGRGYAEVRFDDLRLSLYFRDGTYHLAAAASGVHFVKAG